MVGLNKIAVESLKLKNTTDWNRYCNSGKKPNNDKKITICHVPPGNPGNMHKITISYNALQTHLNHGDFICAGHDQ